MVVAPDNEGVIVAWWYNLLSGKVEEGAGAPNSERLGPYETEADAQHALEKAKERNEAWDKDNLAWDGDNE
jgi:hypothetical protein